MQKYPLWKSFTVILLVLLGIIFSIPSIIYNDDSDNWFLKNKINLGYGGNIKTCLNFSLKKNFDYDFQGGLSNCKH